eukprot:6459761-Amphidinium_carterae.1
MLPNHGPNQISAILTRSSLGSRSDINNYGQHAQQLQDLLEQAQNFNIVEKIARPKLKKGPFLKRIVLDNVAVLLHHTTRLFNKSRLDLWGATTYRLLGTSLL